MRSEFCFDLSKALCAAFLIVRVCKILGLNVLNVCVCLDNFCLGLSQRSPQEYS